MLWAENSTNKTKNVGFIVDASNSHSVDTSQSYIYVFENWTNRCIELGALQGTGGVE